MSESAFIVYVPEADGCVGALRERFDPSASLGVPAHITVLFPFMAHDRISPDILGRAEWALSSAHAFAFDLIEVRRFPAATYLAPEPAGPFVSLTSALAHTFPEHPPFGGQFTEVVPHLTVAHGSAFAAAAAARQLTAVMNVRGTIRSTCTSIALIENSCGYWRDMHTFTLLPR